MAIIQLILALIILGFLYIRMIRREILEPISKAQAVVPVVLGAVSVFVSFVLFMLLGALLVQLGISSSRLPAIIHSFILSLRIAGIPEELAKLAFILLTLLIFRSRIRNVYEYILAGAGVGFGFTLLEEFFYGSEGPIGFLRLVTIAAHMIFGIIMAKHLGLAAYSKVSGVGNSIKEYLLAFFVPVLIHTLYDAFSANNQLLKGTEDEQAVGIILAIAATIILFIAQIIVLRNLKRDANKYCEMIIVKLS